MLANTKPSKDLQIIPRSVLDYGKGRPGFPDACERILIKNFKTHPALNGFFEENAGFLSLQWIKLGKADKISVHEHEVDTLIISCMGECLLVGDMRRIIEEGDAVVIPKHFKHGLLPHTSKLFWGLSLRFYDTVQSLRES